MGVELAADEPEEADEAAGAVVTVCTVAGADVADEAAAGDVAEPPPDAAGVELPLEEPPPDEHPATARHTTAKELTTRRTERLRGRGDVMLGSSPFGAGRQGVRPVTPAVTLMCWYGRTSVAGSGGCPLCDAASAVAGGGLLDRSRHSGRAVRRRDRAAPTGKRL
jgi:hypothetical protein